MQKLINVLAVTSFVVSGAVVGTGVYVYVNKDTLLEKAKEAALEQVTSILPSLLPTPQVPGLGGASAPGSEIAPPSLPFSI